MLGDLFNNRYIYYGCNTNQYYYNDNYSANKDYDSLYGGGYLPYTEYQRLATRKNALDFGFTTTTPLANNNLLITDASKPFSWRMTWPSNIQFKDDPHTPRILKFRIQIVNPKIHYDSRTDSKAVAANYMDLNSYYWYFRYGATGYGKWSDISYQVPGLVGDIDRLEYFGCSEDAFFSWDEVSDTHCYIFSEPIYTSGWVNFPINYTSTTSLTGQFTFNFNNWRNIDYSIYSDDVRYYWSNDSGHDGVESIYSLYCVVDYLIYVPDTYIPGSPTRTTQTIFVQKIIFIGDDLHNIVDTNYETDDPNDWSHFRYSPFGYNFTGQLGLWDSLPLDDFPRVINCDKRPFWQNYIIGSFTKHTPMTFIKNFVKNRLNIGLSNIFPWKLRAYPDSNTSSWNQPWYANVYVS